MTAGPYRERARGELPCPRCASDEATLRAGRVGELPLAECALCGGLWIGPSTMGDLLVDADRQREVLAHAGAAPARAEATVTYLKCPECGQVMDRRNFGRRSGVIVDACRQHGVWFDAGELRRAVEFLVDGGGVQAPAVELPPVPTSAVAREDRWSRLVDVLARLLG